MTWSNSKKKLMLRIGEIQKIRRKLKATRRRRTQAKMRRKEAAASSTRKNELRAEMGTIKCSCGNVLSKQAHKTIALKKEKGKYVFTDCIDCIKKYRQRTQPFLCSTCDDELCDLCDQCNFCGFCCH